MDVPNLPEDKPDFSTLTGIMDRFHKVPYEQFQSELKTWFDNAISKGKPLSPDMQVKLDELVSSIYFEGEYQEMAKCLKDKLGSDQE